MGGRIDNCPSCNAFMRVGDKCTVCHPEVLEQAFAATTTQPTFNPNGPKLRHTKPRNDRDKKLLKYLIASVPSTAAVAHYLVLQMRYDVFVSNVVVLGKPDNGDIHIRKSPDQPWGRVEVKAHPTYSWKRLSKMKAIIVENVETLDKMPELPVAFFVFADDLKRALVCYPRQCQEQLFKRMMPNPNWEGEVETYMLPRNLWREVVIQHDVPA